MCISDQGVCSVNVMAGTIEDEGWLGMSGKPILLGIPANTLVHYRYTDAPCYGSTEFNPSASVYIATLT